MQYFIHGDDFGKSQSSNNAIDQLIMEGKLQSTSLIVNLDSTDNAVSLAQRGKYKNRVYFHLNLSEGEPLTENIKIFGLCNKSGKFCWASSKRIIVACMSASAIKAIRDEIEMQMQRFRELGFTSNRIDSQDMLLFNLPIWLAVLAIAKTIWL